MRAKIRREWHLVESVPLAHGLEQSVAYMIWKTEKRDDQGPKVV